MWYKIIRKIHLGDQTMGIGMNVKMQLGAVLEELEDTRNLYSDFFKSNPDGTDEGFLESCRAEWESKVPELKGVSVNELSKVVKISKLVRPKSSLKKMTTDQFLSVHHKAAQSWLDKSKKAGEIDFRTAPKAFRTWLIDYAAKKGCILDETRVMHINTIRKSYGIYLPKGRSKSVPSPAVKVTSKKREDGDWRTLADINLDSQKIPEEIRLEVYGIAETVAGKRMATMRDSLQALCNEFPNMKPTLITSWLTCIAEQMCQEDYNGRLAIPTNINLSMAELILKKKWPSMRSAMLDALKE